MPASPRLRRLEADYKKLSELQARSAFVRIEATEGNPPEKYVLRLTCKGITDVDGSGRPSYSESHQLGIHLHDEYPTRGPHLQMITPVFHPNVARNGQVCYGDVGDHGWAPAMGLDDLVVRVIKMIRYENMGLESPFNLIARDWAASHRSMFPLDSSQIVGEALPEIVLLEDEPLDIRIDQQPVDRGLIDDIVIS